MSFKKRVPVTFKKGYVWTQELHTKSSNWKRIEKLREKADPKWNQNQLLANESLAKYNWFSSFSTLGFPYDQS